MPPHRETAQLVVSEMSFRRDAWLGSDDQLRLSPSNRLDASSENPEENRHGVGIDGPIRLCSISFEFRESAASEPAR
jgi:hypothetical protein